MRKILAAIALCCPALAQSQPSEAEVLRFDQRIANCENQWFGAKGTDGKIVLGYVYIDPSAGFTFEHYGYLDSSNGTLHANKSDLYDKARLITRIGQNFPATCLTETQVARLGLPLSPESMKFYKDDRPAAEHHASWAYHYNHIGASDIALDHVAKAIGAGSSSLSLTFEHAYALNALGRFDETISLLTPVVASSTKTSDLIAELAFAHLMRGEHQRSIELYTQAIDHDPRNPSQRRWEFAGNIAAAYEQLGQLKERDHWIKISDSYRESNK
jgi:tetratricopeptide (TPR) repeat protein